MRNDGTAALAEHFGELKDPRIDRQKLHSLTDILVITICAAICGADGWVAVERFGKAKKSWLQQFLALSNGIPSHDTFGRFFSILDPAVFREAFISWVTAVSQVSAGEVIAVDGKTLRRSFDTASEKAALHMVNAWATDAGVALGQLATEAKSNEITAIPKLLELLHVKGCIVTIDAMGCQKAITEKIVDKEADYVIACKGNQGTLHQDVKKFFEWAISTCALDKPILRYAETTDGDHGRIEVRRYWATDEIHWLENKEAWKGLSTIAVAEAERTCKGETTLDRRYFISSLPLTRMNDIVSAIRAHWRVENGLHWVLDVAFREDDSRVRTGHATENLGIVRQIALNLLKQETSAKVGVATKRLMAGWDHAYLAKVLGF
jgi:predicted transposase YbfD/YdcC